MHRCSVALVLACALTPLLAACVVVRPAAPLAPAEYRARVRFALAGPPPDAVAGAAVEIARIGYAPSPTGEADRPRFQGGTGMTLTFTERPGVLLVDFLARHDARLDDRYHRAAVHRAVTAIACAKGVGPVVDADGQPKDAQRFPAAGASCRWSFPP